MQRRSIAFLASTTEGPQVPVAFGLGQEWTSGAYPGLAPGQLPWWVNTTAQFPASVTDALAISFPTTRPGGPVVYRHPDGTLSTTPPSRGSSGGGIDWDSAISSLLNVGGSVLATRNQGAQVEGQWVNGRWVTNPNEFQLAVGESGVSGLASLSPWMIAGGLGLVGLLVLVSMFSVNRRK